MKIGNGYKYTDEFRKKVTEDYKRLNRGNKTCSISKVARAFGVSPSTLNIWLGNKQPSVSVTIKNNTITYKGKIFVFESKTPVELTKTQLREEGKKLVKEFNKVSFTMLADMDSDSEYFKTTSRLLRTKIFGELQTTIFKVDATPENIWDSVLATREKLLERNTKLRELIADINNRSICSYRQLLLELK